MLFRRRIIGLVAVGFLIFGVLGMVRSSAYQAGWSRGFSSGQMTAAQQAPSTEAAPVVPQAQPHAHGGHGFWFIGGFFQLLFFFFLLNFIFKMLFWRRWRHRWHKHGRGGAWDGKHGRSCGHHHKHDGGDHDKRSDKERYYDEHGADGPLVDM